VITFLRLENFLRHEDTELRFSPEQQLVVVAGNNGAGKSGLFHAVTYALYGEAPKGRRIDELVRWGAELEGMTVELEFTIGEDVYRVRRRRDGVKSSSTLHLNGAQVVDGAKAVTSYVTKLLGMDVAGFRLAFVAEQGELDGLASLRPGERAKMLSRMLRLDAIEAARHKAREIYNHERKVVQALGHGLDLDELSRTLEEATAERDLYAAELDSARASVAKLDSELAEGASVKEAWQQANIAQTRAEAALEAARSETERISSELSSIVIPEEPTATRALVDVTDELGALEVSIVRAESSKALFQQRQLAASEIARAHARLAEIATLRQELGEPAAALSSADQLIATSAAREQRLRAELDAARDRYSATKARLALAERQLADLQELTDVCDRCGQGVEPSHHDQLVAETSATVETLRTDLGEARTVGEALTEQLAEVVAQAASATTAREQALGELAQERTLVDEQAELVRRRDTYQGTLDRLVVEDVDLEELYARKGELAIERATAEAAHVASAARSEMLVRQAELTARLAGADQRVAEAQDALTAAAPSQELLAAHAALADLAAAREGEVAIAAHLAAEHAASSERVKAAERDLVRANAALDRRKTHQLKAQTAENASLLLGEVSEILSTQIRPALQGAVTDLLTRLSNGRFTEVSITDTYEVKVLDGGEYVDLAALSGGEQDLVALAVRLALAEVVTARQGVAGIGTLVLDEVFGSQDAGRQQAIVSALRSLREVYGQILLISHVGGLDECADAVVTVTTDPDRTTTEVNVS
jgi:DNA repair protein SbcC/Rad50